MILIELLKKLMKYVFKAPTTNKVCSSCIGEEYLRHQVNNAGVVGQCRYCQSSQNPTINFDDLAEQVHSVLEEHFQMTSPDPEDASDLLAAKFGHWEQSGEPVTYAIMNLIDSSEDLAEDIRNYLSDQYDPAGKDAMIDPCPYADDSYYEESKIDTYEFQESWSSFRHEILSRSRFFNQKAKTALDHLFEGIAQLVTHEGDTVVRTYTLEDVIYRARVAKTEQEVENILKYAPNSLGPPPGEYASGGRMNAEGISVFYGATDIETCIAEIRAPVGSYVVSGCFLPRRDLRILDLTRLEKVYIQGSLFDHNHSESLSRVHFLKRLQAELSQPVIPGSESRDYLPTQVVAEYLGFHPEMNLDGVMFSSSQISNGEEEDALENGGGKNVVLFSHACQLEPYNLPKGASIDVSLIIGDPDDPMNDFYISENVPADPPQQEGDGPVGQNFFDDLNPLNELDNPGMETEPDIRLVMESIEVRRVEGVSYKTFPFGVSRYRHDPEDIDF